MGNDETVIYMYMPDRGSKTKCYACSEMCKSLFDSPMAMAEIGECSSDHRRMDCKKNFVNGMSASKKRDVLCLRRCNNRDQSIRDLRVHNIWRLLLISDDVMTRLNKYYQIFPLKISFEKKHI